MQRRDFIKAGAAVGITAAFLFPLFGKIQSEKAQGLISSNGHDAAAWSAITPLSERSIENNGEPQDFPDFTRGRWIKRKPVFALGDDF